MIAQRSRLDGALDDIASREPHRVEDGWAKIDPVIWGTIRAKVHATSLGPLMGLDDLHNDVVEHLITSGWIEDWPATRDRGYSGVQFIWRRAGFAAIDCLRVHMGRASTRRSRRRGVWDVHLEDPTGDGLTLGDMLVDRGCDPAAEVEASDLWRSFEESLTPLMAATIRCIAIGITQAGIARSRGVTEAAIAQQVKRSRAHFMAKVAA